MAPAKQNSPITSFFAGAVGGSIDACFTMPFDAVKTQIQKDPRMGALGVRCVAEITQKAGVGGLYRGFVPFNIMAAGKASVRWAGMAALQNAADKMGADRKKDKAFWDFSCGFGAGVFEGIVWTAPAERLKVLRQTSASFGEQPITYRHVFERHGVTGLWVGGTATAMRSAANASIRFAIAGQVQEFFRFVTNTPADSSLSLVWNMLAGGTGGAISACCSNPFDVLKTRIQAGYKGGMASCARDFVAERGVVALATSGLSARVPQIFLSQAIQFAIIMRLQELFG
jgi:hypothetical protein